MKSQESPDIISKKNKFSPSDLKENERRKCFRVRTTLPFKYKIIDKNSSQSKNCQRVNKLYNDCNLQYGLTEEKTVSSTDREILFFLKRVDEKLNFLIKSLKLKDGDDLCPGELTEITLSGNGLSFTAKTSLKKGEQLEIEIDFQDQIPSPLLVTGKVINCQKDSGSNYNISVAFINLLPFEEKKIMKHTFACQRETIRKP